VRTGKNQSRYGTLTWRVSFVAVAAAIALLTRASTTLIAQGPASTAATVDVEGTLEVQVEDAATSSRVHHFLHVGDRRLRLTFDSEPIHLMTGSKVRAHGKLANEMLALSSSDGSSVQVLALAGSNTLGEQRTAVILVNFQDNPSTPYDWTSAYVTTFQTTSDFYRENSYGQTWLTGDVYGWFTLPMTSTTCDTNQIAMLAGQALTNAGVNLSAYAHRVYAFPQTSACSWWGTSTVGGTPSMSFVNGPYALKVVAHELGHGLGDYHSHSQPCDPGNGCTSIEYGDDHDIMGNPSVVGHFNAFQKERLGWLNYGISPPIETVTQTGTYWIDAIETQSSNSKALKILKSVDSWGYQTWYYVETRAQSGFDGGVAPGVLVHTGSESTPNSSYQIDLTPSSTSVSWMLGTGQSFFDAAIGLSITTVSAGQAGAFVAVSYGGLQCTTGAPTLTLSPATTLTTSPGKSVSYSVAVTNADGTACVPLDLAMTAAAPTGWTAVLTPSVMTIAPGSSANASLTLTPPAGADGYFDFMVSASRTTTTGLGGSVSGGLTVASGLNVSVTAASDSSLSASVRLGSAAVSGAKVTFTVRSPSGGTSTLSATTNTSGIASAGLHLKPKDAKGTYQVQVTAISNGLTGSATGSFVH
jgi:M6 family metalloprotease-like protein